MVLEPESKSHLFQCFYYRNTGFNNAVPRMVPIILSPLIHSNL
jgi:hypothetical protein